MKNVKNYIVSLLALMCMAPMAAMQKAPQPLKSALTTKDRTIKNIETEVNTITEELIASLTNLRNGKAKNVSVIKPIQRLGRLINALPVATMNKLRQVLIAFATRVDAYDKAPANTSFESARELAVLINLTTKEIKSRLQEAYVIAAMNEKLANKKAALQDKKQVTFNVRLEQVRKFRNTPEQIEYRKGVPLNHDPIELEEEYDSSAVAQSLEVPVTVTPVVEPVAAPIAALEAPAEIAQPEVPVVASAQSNVLMGKRNKAALARNSIFAAAGLAGLGYIAYAYLGTSASASASNATIVTQPTIQFQTPVSTPAPLAAVTVAPESGTDIYGWLAGQAINLFQ